jgi:hypothetical protein
MMTHHHLASQSKKGDDGKVAARSAGGGIDDQKQRLRPYEREGWLGDQHRLNVGGPKALLQRVKGQPRELRLDKIRPIGHDRLEALVTQ